MDPILSLIHIWPSFKGYQGFPAALCVSVNDEIVHGIPDDRMLEEGDMVSLDVGAELHGYHGDAARTYGVGEVDAVTQQLMRVTEECFWKGDVYKRQKEVYDGSESSSPWTTGGCHQELGLPLVRWEKRF